jgi:DNA-binding response OmpR family regulator
MKILVIEDDKETADFLKVGLEADSFIVDVAHDGIQGSYLARITMYDVIIIDYSLPNKDGLTVCGEIRASGSESHIIFLTVDSISKHKVSALENGADDYMTKPFSFDELKARIKALMRRPRKIESPILIAGNLTLNMEKQVAHRDYEPIYLTRKEYILLEYLMRNKGTVLSRGMIMEHVWNAESDPFSNTVEAHILNLRKKINFGNKRDLIRNIPGRGYIIDS